MKIAIIGAGIAGLSCAIVLEKHGIIPIIFERLDSVGDREQHVAAMLHVVDRPMGDSLKYLKKEFDINVSPISQINKVTHVSPGVNASITGYFGNFILRDKSRCSIKGQLQSQLHNTEIIYNTTADYKELSKEYDYVVLADGKPNAVEELGCWQGLIRGYLKGATVAGDFNTNELIVWLNKEYNKNGYAYLTPFNAKKATLAHFVPGTNEHEIDYYWDLLFKTEKLPFDVLETYKVKHTAGFVYPHKWENIYFCGNTGGAIDSFLGFGQVNSILSGGRVAEAIADNKDINKTLMSLDKKQQRLYEFRMVFDQATNKHYDMMLKALKLPMAKITMHDTPFNLFQLGALGFRLKKKLFSK